MAGYIKGITIEFGADVTALNSALKQTQGTLNKTQSELRQVNQALKFNPGNTTLLKQKFDLLKASVTQTEDKLKQLKSMQASMNAAGVDKASAQYRQLEREIIKTESQLKTAQASLKSFGSVGKQQAIAVGQAFQTAGGKIKAAGRTITTTVSMYGAAGIIAGKKIIDMSQQQAQAEQKLAEIYKTRMGVGKQAVKSTLDLASAQQKLGVIGDEVQLAAAQQLATYAQTPKTVNTMLPALNNLLVQQKGLNATQEDATGLANLFGKAMMGQTGALKRAGISFTAAQEEVLKYGTEEEKAATIAEVVTQNVGNMNAEFAKTDAGKIQQAKNALGDMGEQIGAVLLPAVAKLVSWFQEHLMPKLEALINYLQQHPAIAKFALALAALSAVMGPLIIVIGSLVSAIGSIITIAPIVGGAFTALTGPIGIAIAAITAAIAIGVALYKNWDLVKAKLKAIWGAIKTAAKTTFNAVKTAITTPVKAALTAVKTVFNSIKSAITAPINAAKESVKKAISKIKSILSGKISLPHIKLPHFHISGRFSLDPPSIPHFSVDWYDKGGVFNSPSIIGVAEKRPEFVGALDDLRKIVRDESGGTVNTINVYASDGMDVNALAVKVEQKLVQLERQRQIAYGNI